MVRMWRWAWGSCGPSWCPRQAEDPKVTSSFRRGAVDVPAPSATKASSNPAARVMATITVTDRHRGTVIARSGVLVGVRMTVPSYSIGVISLGDRAGDGQPLRTLLSRLVKEEEFRRALQTPAMAFTELTLLHIPSGSTFEIEVRPLP